MRESILSSGGEVHFQARVTQLVRTSDVKSVIGARTKDGREFTGEGVILATGTALDIYELWFAKKFLAAETLRDGVASSIHRS